MISFPYLSNLSTFSPLTPLVNDFSPSHHYSCPSQGHRCHADRWIPGATLSPRPIWPCRIAAPLHKMLLPDLPLPSYLLSSAGPLNAVVAEFYSGHFGSFCVLSTWVNRMWCPHLGALAASVFSWVLVSLRLSRDTDSIRCLCRKRF